MVGIGGGTAAQIAQSVREEIKAGRMGPGSPLPPIRALAQDLGVNRNTVAAAYRDLATSGLVASSGRRGTAVRELLPVPEDGYSPGTVLRDVGSGNPAPDLLPNPYSVPPPADYRPGMYGEATIAPALAAFAREWFAADVAPDFSLTLTSGSVDAVERLLAASLAPGELVAVEDPCFLASINTLRLAGYRPYPVPVDAHGPSPQALHAALAAGAQAFVCTPRAHNPTGASLTAARAAQLRRILAGHPKALVIADDHFSLLARTPFHSVLPRRHESWALVRSVSKFLGPDLRVALVAADPGTTERMATRLRPGALWVSHLLQHAVHGLLTDPATGDLLTRAAGVYGSRSAAFAAQLRTAGLGASADDGLNVWVDTHTDAHRVSTELMKRGWLARTGSDFVVGEPASPVGQAAARHLRVTVVDLEPDAATRLAETIVACSRG